MVEVMFVTHNKTYLSLKKHFDSYFNKAFSVNAQG